MKARMICVSACIAGALTVPTPAAAIDWSLNTKVTMIEITYFPSSIVFEIPQAAGACPANSLLHYYPKGADQTSQNLNMQAALSVLLSAKTSGQTVTLFGENSGCQIDFLYAQ